MAFDRRACFDEGLALYRAGEPYEAHEKWEELWQDEANEDHRRFLQALIQVASAAHKLTNAVEPRGGLRLIERALAKLEGLPDHHGGIDVAKLRVDLARFREEAERALAAGQTKIAPDRVPPIDRAPEASASKGIAWRASGFGNPALANDVEASRAFRMAVAAYGRGAYYEAHEHWEELWRDEPDALRKRFLQGLIFVAAAMHKVFAMKSAEGAVRLLRKADERLRDMPEGLGGLGVRSLLHDARVAEQALAVLASEGRHDLDPALVPKLAPAPS